MGNQFENVMSQRTDEALEKIVNSPQGDYQSEAVKAVKQEIKKRQLVREKQSMYSDEQILEILNSSKKYQEYEWLMAEMEAMKRNIMPVKEENQTKERHWFVTLWLWLMILANCWILIANFIGTMRVVQVYQEEAGLLIKNMLSSMLVFALIIVFSIALLRWKKWGFWAFCALIPIALIWNIVTVIGLDIIILPVITVVVLLAILQIKKNGISCWKQLE